MKNAIAIRCSTPEAAQHRATILQRRNPKWVIEVKDKQVNVLLKNDMTIWKTAKEMQS